MADLMEVLEAAEAVPAVLGRIAAGVKLIFDNSRRMFPSIDLMKSLSSASSTATIQRIPPEWLSGPPERTWSRSWLARI